MRLELVPKDDAPLANKKSWVIYQLVRYRNFHKRGLFFKYLFELLMVVNLVAWLGLWSLPLAVMLFFATDYAYDYITFIFLRDFYTEFGNYLFDDKKSNDTHDLVVLMNNLGNALNNKDEAIAERLNKRLRENYDDLAKRKEISHEQAPQVQVPQEVQGREDVAS